MNQIASRLTHHGVISSPFIFSVNVRLRGKASALRAGEYRFSKNRTPFSVMEQLVQGRTFFHGVTIPEGLTCNQILKILKNQPHLEGELSKPPAEGTLLPETYYYSRGDLRSEILDRMRVALKNQMNGLWKNRSKDLPFDTPEEAITLASIVEKETFLPKERPRIAGVFVNRLRRGMRLQSDPTVIYGIEAREGSPLDRALLRKDLGDSSPYNTYQIEGLPPGPICNPGIEAIRAVLHPLKTDELFFVADGTGAHVFSATLKGHQRNHNAWRKIRAERLKKQKKKEHHTRTPKKKKL